MSTITPANLPHRRASFSQEEIQAQDTSASAPSMINKNTQDTKVSIDDDEDYEALFQESFGIFDSLTLTKERVPSLNLLEDEDFEDDLNEEDMKSWTNEDNGKIDFESSLDDVTKIGDFMPIQIQVQGQARRRAGLRRGYQDSNVVSDKTFNVSTKHHDGPTPYASRALYYKPVMDTTDQRAPAKPMRSPAA